jgi:pyrroloquinoline quinone biosynthesis protein B|tara:strand:+ start:12540 stop:13481 length:942 start_codon:yes stop_codon:yes gene_type:complete
MSLNFRISVSSISFAALTLFSSTLVAQADPYIFILGVAQDAGFPQSSCFAPHCMPGWKDKMLRRGATSLAVIDPTAKSKVLFEATPQLPSQLYDLHNEAPDGEYSLDGVFLTHAHIGHYAGLMFFGHEAQGASEIPVYAMPRMAEFIRDNGPWSQLVTLKNIELKDLKNQQGNKFPNLIVTPFLVPHRDEFSETVGYRIEGPNKTAIFIPDINKWDVWEQDIAQLVRSVDYALLDATFYADGELGNRDMSQIPHPFVSQSMATFDHLSPEDKNKVWFIHLNHTNPLLNSQSSESKYVRSQGYNIAAEGDRLPL